MPATMQELLDSMPQRGRVEWMGLRPGRREPLLTPECISVDTASGIIGDRYAGRSGRRQVTLIQAEHMAAVAGVLGLTEVDWALLRRNIVVSGVNLLALHKRQFRIGSAVLEATGYCHPCSRMEENLGPGGYNAMRGHGGLTARVIRGGEIRLGDAVGLLTQAP